MKGQKKRISDLLWLRSEEQKIRHLHGIQTRTPGLVIFIGDPVSGHQIYSMHGEFPHHRFDSSIMTFVQDSKEIQNSLHTSLSALALRRDLNIADNVSVHSTISSTST